VQDYEFAILIGGASQVHRGSGWLPGGQVGEADVAVLTAEQDRWPSCDHECVLMCGKEVSEAFSHSACFV
jgi:hypothetical protein